MSQEIACGMEGFSEAAPLFHFNVCAGFTVGFDREPVISSKEDLGQVSYTNLRGGTYTFRLNLEGDSSEARSASVTIVKLKAFYEQPVFWIALAFALPGETV